MKEQIAKFLLEIEAVFLRPNEPFTWASGIKSPIYCDNRLILTAPKARKVVEESLANLIKTKFPATDLIMGTATAGIAHAAIAASILDLPMGYVRSGSKNHGRENQIEGKISPGQKAVVVEDLISTAGSSIETVQTLRNAGLEIEGIVSIFTYGMKSGLDNLAKANITNTSLTDFDTLINVAVKNKYIKESDIDRLLAFRDNPKDESWIVK